MLLLLLLLPLLLGVVPPNLSGSDLWAQWASLFTLP